MLRFRSQSLFLLISILFVNICNAQSLLWTTQLKGNETKAILGAAVDAAGNIYSVGTFESVVDFDPGPGVLSYNAGGDYENDIFIIKQSPGGILVWARQIGANPEGYCLASSISIGPSGDLYIAGEFDRPVDFDPGPGVFTMTGDEETDIFILRLTDDGDFVWAKKMSCNSLNVDYPGVVVDQSGNIILSIVFYGTFDFDPGPSVVTLTSTPPSIGLAPDIAICKLNPSGDFLWVKQIGGSFAEKTETIKTDNAGNILHGGFVNGLVDIDPGPGVVNIGAASQTTAYISKLSPNGDFVWGLALGVPEYVKDVTTDNQGNHYVFGTDIYNGFIAKLSPAGTLQWRKELNGDNVNSLDDRMAIVADSQGDIYITATLSGEVDFDPGPGFYYVKAIGNELVLAKFSQNGGLAWVKQVHGNHFVEPGFLVMDHEENLIVGGQFHKTIDFDPGPDVYALTSEGLYPNGDLFIAKYSRADINMITGRTFKDNNGDGIRQATEPYLANVMVKGIRGNLTYYSVSDSNGIYRIRTDTGAFQVNPTLPSYYNSFQPTNHSASFGSLYGQSDTANHFGLTATPSAKDLKIHITNVGRARSGFQTNYRVTYINTGTDTLSGNIALTLDSRLSFVTATPAPANYTAPVARWDFINLPPSQSRNIDVQLRVPPTVTNGTVLKSYAQANPVAGDANPQNNLDSLFQIVTGSFDPNDKRVAPDGPITPEFVNTGNHLDYTVRFQNTGTDTAFTVIIKDTLSNNLDISSFQTLSASHVYTLTMEKNGVIVWTFPNILLPDSNVNEPASHGFVRYTIRPKTALSVGETIRNKAAIYFDYNVPIVTNETVNTITVITSVNPDAENIESKVFPNPAHSALHINVKGYFYFTIYDVLGKTVKSPTRIYNQTTVDMGKLAKGLYFIEIKTHRGKAVHKILVN